ncbi:cation efflux protein [Suillus clintonianus]|uniref:cation efflux protein n=1 Tax=Suillus clintonianus TaxID=1904413 RepID=UPI001B875C0F|nr:cation efflux protein [Suillus clintonianus]KAG2141358.1 cation efflux protein [Suillus clintonianus]
MSPPDARTRRKISLKPAKVLTGSISNRLIPIVLPSNVIFVLALYAAKELLLSYDVGVFWVLMRVLACGGLGMMIWEAFTGKLMRNGNIEWTAIGVSSLLLFVQQAALFTALYRLPSPRVMLFSHFSAMWVDSFIAPASMWKPILTFSSFLLSFASDAILSRRSVSIIAPGYGALVMHGISTYALEHLRGVLAPTVNPTLTTAVSTLGAAVVGLPLYAFRQALLDLPPTPIVPLTSLAVLPILAYTMIFLTPDTIGMQFNVNQTSQMFLVSYPFAFIVATAMGFLGFSQRPHWIDLLLGVMLYYSIRPDNDPTLSGPSRTPVPKVMRFYLNSILSDPESRKIFYFLMLNLAFMLVQMLYGVWTNSLGLISDAIHMAFDCLAIGVGLLASIMAKWPPDERFTYGYGRIETLSGFANGIFLILISVFIVFEAIQRILDPPEMTTNQLLLISSLGLGVNLFGMYAMGGHHHHGHSHNHGHDHQHHSHNGHSHHDHSHAHGDHVHEHDSHPVGAHSHDHAPSKPSEPLQSSLSHEDSHAHKHSSHLHSSNHSSSCSDHDSHSHLDSHSHSDHAHTHPPPSPLPVDQEGPSIRGRKPHSRGPSLHIPTDGAQVASAIPFPLSSPSGVDSPLSPSYPSTLKHDHHHHYHHGMESSEHSSHDHDHGHDHEHEHVHHHEGHSDNMRGVFLHVMADTLGSVGVIISTLLIQFYGWTIFDPIASLFIAIMIAASVIPLVIDTGRVLSLDMGTREKEVQQALSELAFVDGVASYSSPQFWPKDSANVIGSIHIQLALSSHKHPNTDGVRKRVHELLRSRISGLEELTIQLEEEGDSLGSR